MESDGRPVERVKPRWRRRVVCAIVAVALVLVVKYWLGPDEATRMANLTEFAYSVISPPPPTVLSAAGRKLVADVGALGGQWQQIVQPNSVRFLGIMGPVESFHIAIADPNFTDYDLARLVRNHGERIWSLRLSNTKVTVKGLRHLSGLWQLQRLSVVTGNATPVNPGDRARTNDPGAVPLDLPRLADLDLCGMPVTDFDLQLLTSLPNLERLRLSRTAVQGASLGSLTSLPKLVSLALDDAPITEDGLRQLDGAARLQSLALDGVPLSRAGLKYVLGLPRLSSLSIARCGLPEEEIKRLRVERPELRIPR